MKRFQELNWFGKLLRYRWYLLIPFKFIYNQYFKPLKCTEHDEDFNIVETFNIKGKMLWKILKGEAQGKMEWYYTMEEVQEKIFNLKDEN